MSGSLERIKRLEEDLQEARVKLNEQELWAARHDTQCEGRHKALNVALSSMTDTLNSHSTAMTAGFNRVIKIGAAAFGIMLLMIVGSKSEMGHAIMKVLGLS